MRRTVPSLLAPLLAALVVLLGLVVPAAASADLGTSAAVAHFYDGHRHAVASSYTASERGPPAATRGSNIYDAGDRWSYGDSALRTGFTNGAASDYDGTALLVQTNNIAATTSVPVRLINGDPSPFLRWRVAAETGTVAGEQATIHGAERLTQAGFDEATVAATKAGRVLQQADGATVYVNEVSPGKYDFIIQGGRGVVTAHRGWSFKSVTRLAGNYGWQGWP